MPYLYSPERYAKSVVEVQIAAEQARRDLADFSWMAFVCTNLHEDGRARARG